MNIEQWPIAKIKPYANNPRKNDSAVDKVAMSLKEYGWQQPIVVDGKGVIIVGHTRWKAAKKLNMDTCPVLVAEGLSTAQVKAYRIADNKTNEFAAWDDELLKLEIDELVDLDFDIELTGFDPSDFDLGEPNGGLTDEDAVPEPPEKPVTKLGDLWVLGSHRLLCGDSTDIEQVSRLMDGQKADMVFTDPPFPNNSKIMHEMIKNIEGAFNNARSICRGLMIWFWDNLEHPPFQERITSKHIWHKTNGWQAGHFETMYCFHNDNKRHEQNVYSVNNVGGDNKRNEQGNHPTPKPVKLISDILQDFGGKIDIILDPFLGSGSTLIACEKTNRKCFGLELDPHYCDVILKRWSEYTGKDPVREDGVKFSELKEKAVA